MQRVNEVALVLGSFFVVMWLLPTLVPSTQASLSAMVPSIQTFICSIATIVIAIAAKLVHSKKYDQYLTSLALVALAGTVLLAITSTGNMSSHYLPLWVTLGLFSAIAGRASFYFVIAAVIVYASCLVYVGGVTPTQWIAFGLVIAAPVLGGNLLWRSRNQIQSDSSQAVTELAHELSDETSKSEIIVNSITDGVLLLDPSGVIQLINPAAQSIIGWGSEDATKLDYRSVLKIIDDKNNPINETLDPVLQCIKTNQSVATDTLGIRTTSGKQLIASITATPLNAQANSGTIVVFRDITAKRAEERDQAEFISTASHEMRTPVAAIEGYLGLALNPQTATIDEKARSYLGKAQDSAHHLGRLFQDLLDISKLEDGRMQNNPTILDTATIVRSILEDFRGQFTEKGLTLIYTPDTNGSGLKPLFYVNADVDHFQEVFSNLTANAIKYTKEGSVTVDIKGDDEHVYISVADSGIGIPAEDIQHLFQKFYRVDNTDTREIGGTGLGLYLSRRLTESMGGHLTVESTYGKGSIFTIDLPRVSSDTAQNATVTDATVRPTQTDVRA